MRSCLLIAITVYLAPAMKAQGGRGWEWQNPLPQGNSINCIRFAPDKVHGWAVGGDGVILHTDDGGFSWDTQTVGKAIGLNSIYVVDRQRAFVVGARGIILSTHNGGERWIELKTPTKDHLYSITFARDDPKHGWAVGTYGTVLNTSDGGLTWLAQKI